MDFKIKEHPYKKGFCCKFEIDGSYYWASMVDLDEISPVFGKYSIETMIFKADTRWTDTG